MRSAAALMDRAIELSQRGFPAPNPRVGCVLAKGDEIVGEGWHEFAGGPHAEIAALAAAGDAARGTTAYVTLEPCDHTGRTGPCSLALIAAGVARVVYAVPDPNPKAAGGGVRLIGAGIPIEAGLRAESAAEANRAWLTAQRLGRPYVTLKAAVSLDGRVALPDGSSRWITGPIARADAHRLRAERGAVLVGRRTVEVDDPLLTARIDGVKNPPLRIVLDPNDRLREDRRVFDDSAPTLRAVREPHRSGDVAWSGDLGALLRDLFDRGVTGVLVEGGARTHAGFLAEGIADEIVLYVAPKILGAGPAWIEGDLPNPLDREGEFVLMESTPLGADLRVTYRRTA